MARGALIHRADILLADEERGRYFEQRLSLAQHPSETPTRLLVRLLAWCLLAEPDMQFTRGLSTREEPDLWLLDEHGHPRHWVEVGEPDPERLRRILNHTDEVSVFSYAAPPNQWWSRNHNKLESLGHLNVFGLNPGDIAPLTMDLPRNFAWQVTLSPGGLHLVDHRDQLHWLPVETLI